MGTPINIGVTVTPASFTFGNQTLSSAGLPGTFTVTNAGNANLSLTNVNVTGDFSQTNNCGTTLAVETSCEVIVIFAPTLVGNRTEP